VDQALAHAWAMASQQKASVPGTLTIGALFDIYDRNGLHGRTARHAAEVRRKLGLWRAFLGAQRPVHALSPTDVERFVHARRTGTLCVDSGAVGRPVGMTTIWHDYVALTTAVHFGVRYRDAHGRRLLTANPLDGVRVSKSVSPARPVADRAYYGALREAGEQVHRQFSVALDLAYSTGHRIDAILRLRWNDINFVSSPHAPYGTLRWRAENDKIENEHVVPINQLAHDALAALAKASQVIGEAYVFPSERNANIPVDRHLASRWLRRAERLAGVDHVAGRGWHSFRRAWASARKHLPDVDVAAAGGWKDTATMKRCYQHADAIGVLRAVTEPMGRASGEH
jgi:integrase